MGSKTLCQETDVQIRKLKESLLKNYLQSNEQGLRTINRDGCSSKAKGKNDYQHLERVTDRRE